MQVTEGRIEILKNILRSKGVDINIVLYICDIDSLYKLTVVQERCLEILLSRLPNI